jgi:predicted CopG family antitoxin
MMKPETDSYSDIIPGLDVLQWKRENQARILRETEGMTDEEVRERRRQICERADKRRAERATT